MWLTRIRVKEAAITSKREEVTCWYQKGEEVYAAGAGEAGANVT